MAVLVLPVDHGPLVKTEARELAGTRSCCARSPSMNVTLALRWPSIAATSTS